MPKPNLDPRLVTITQTIIDVYDKPEPDQREPLMHI